ncbi:hypothetical protein JCM10049v2_004136 [Rhodotorula toruloides]
MAPSLANVEILPAQPQLHVSPARSPSANSLDDLKDDKVDAYGKSETTYDKSETTSLSSRAPLAPRADIASHSAGAAILRLLGVRKRSAFDDPDAVATQESVYDGPLAAAYAPSDEWENKAAFDPSFRWTNREEKALKRKLDIKIFLWVAIMFLALDIDRANLANATADNLLKDLGLTHGDYNLGNTLSKLGFLIAELPSQMIGKKIGVDIWLPTQIVVFSILSFAQFWMNGRTSFLALRFLIAAGQGGFVPDVILYLSYFYTKSELVTRLSWWYTINISSNTLTAFLAVGLLKMRGVGGYAGWRWMFLIEGLLTLLVGIASFFLLTPGPSQTKAKWRPNGYFTDREVKIIVNKVLRDDPTKASMHNRQALTPKLLWKSACDYDLWPLYLLGLTFDIPGNPISYYFQISMKSLGFSTVMANVLAVPNTIISIVTLLLLAIASELTNNRWAICAIQNVWFVACLIPLRMLPDPISPWTYFALATVLLGSPYAHSVQVTWCSRLAGSVRTRTFSASLYNMAVQTSAIIGANIYQADDAPRYKRGNTILLAIAAWNLVVMYPGIFLYYRARNAHKERKWNAMSVEEQKQYLETTTDEGCKRLDFRFVY